MEDLVEELRETFNTVTVPINRDPFYDKLNDFFQPTVPSTNEMVWERFGRKIILRVLSDYIVTQDDVDNQLKLVVQLVNLVPDEDHPLRVQRSNIPNAGYGLFYVGQNDIEDDLATYGGRVTDYNQNSMYLVDLSDTNVERFKDYKIDGEFGFKLGDKGRWANTRIKAKENNAEFRVSETAELDDYGDDIPTLVISTKDGTTIAPGDEIFVDYGEEYRNRLREMSTKKTRVNTCITCKTKEARFVEKTNPHNVYCSSRCQYNKYHLF